MTDNMNLNNAPEKELEAEQLEQVSGGGGCKLKNDLNIIGGAKLHEIISGGSPDDTDKSVLGNAPARGNPLVR